jgi:hypothetical protein
VSSLTSFNRKVVLFLVTKPLTCAQINYIGLSSQCRTGVLISEGLIDGCDLVFLAKSKDSDYHQKMNSFVFLEWFENQLMPALKNPSLVVLDNTSYHPCFIHVHNIKPCFPKRFDLSQIITPIIDNRHLIVQNSSIFTYFFHKYIQDQ